MDHGKLNQGFAAVGQRFVLFAESAVAPEPRESALDNPSLRRNGESLRLFVPPDDLDHATGGAPRPVDQTAGVTAVGPDQLESAELPLQTIDHDRCSVAILDARGMHDHRQDQSQGIDDQMAFAPFDLLPRVVPAFPPFSADFTDWLSSIPAEGVGLRPALTRTFRRRAS